MSYFDARERVEPLKSAKGQMELTFDFDCPHCGHRICADADEFVDAASYEDACWECGSPVEFTISEAEHNFIRANSVSESLNWDPIEGNLYEFSDFHDFHQLEYGIFSRFVSGTYRYVDKSDTMWKYVRPIQCKVGE